MPRVGDGTGQGKMPPKEEGLSHVGGDEPEKPGGTLKSGTTAHPHHDGPHRTSRPHGGGKSE